MNAWVAYLKTPIIVIVLLGVLLITGCSESKSQPVTGAAVSEVKTEQQPVIPEVQKATCKDECNTSMCNGYKFVTCEKQSDGCQHKTEALTVGKCGIQCLSDTNCGANQKCNLNYECEAVEAKIQPKVCEPNELICDNLRVLQCKSDGTELEEINRCKVRCSEGKCYADTNTPTASGSLQELRDSLRDLSNKLAETTRINKKIDDCAVKCSGEDANIPAFKDQFYAACYQIYYYTGEAELDKFAATC